MPDVRDPPLPLRAAAVAREAAGLQRCLWPRAPGPDGIIDLASNDYLGMCQDPHVVQGAVSAAQGLETSQPAAALVGVLLGAPETAAAGQRLFASHGVRAGCFRPPSLPARRSCLRLAARASLSEADFATVAQALAAVGDHARTAASAGRN